MVVHKETLERMARASTVIYVSGPMSGYVDHNFPAFKLAAKQLRDLGHPVIDPSENDNGDYSQSWEYYMKKDLSAVTKSDVVVVLPGWKNSKGANAEVLVASLLKIPVFTLESFLDGAAEPITVLPEMKMVPRDPSEDKAESIVEEATRLVGGDRQNAYGHPYHDFNRTSTMWNGLLSEKLKEGMKIEPEEVGMMMVLLKLSRHMNKKKRDNLVDAHGYLITVDMVESFNK